MSGSEDLDGAAAMPETMPEIVPEAVADEHSASREIGGMAVYAEPNDGSLYGSASDEEHDAAEEDGDVDADAAPTRAELLKKIAVLEKNEGFDNSRIKKRAGFDCPFLLFFIK